MRMMLPFSIAALRRLWLALQPVAALWCCGSGASRVLKTLCTANAGHARMPDERFGSVVLVVAPALCQGRAVLLSEVPARRNISRRRDMLREGTGTRETVRVRMTNQRKNNYKDD